MRVSTFATRKKLRPYSPGKVNHARTDNDYLWCHVAHGSLFLSHNFLANNKTQERYIKTNVILLKDYSRNYFYARLQRLTREQSARMTRVIAVCHSMSSGGGEGGALSVGGLFLRA